MANLFQPSLQRATDSNGEPVSGAKMYFFLTGTTTPATWYTDEGGKTPGTNPLTADSSGKFPTPAYLDPYAIYRIRLTQEDGETLVWPDVDPVRGYDQGMITDAAETVEALAPQVQANANQVAADTARVIADAAQVAKDKDDAEAAADVASNLGNAPLYDALADLPTADGTKGWAIIPYGPDEGIYQDTGTWTKRSDTQAVRAGVYADEAEAAANSLGVTETVGRPNGTNPVTGTALGGSAYVYATPVDFDGDAYRLRAWSTKAGGVIRLSRWSKVGDDFTMIASHLYEMPSMGLVDLDIYGTFPVEVGDYIGVQGYGVLVFNSAAADSGGVYSGGSFGATSFTDASPSATIRLEIGVDFGVPAAGYLTSRDDAAASRIEGDFTLGKLSTPKTGSAATRRIYVPGVAAPADGFLKSVRAYALTSGTWSIRVYDRAGDTFTEARRIDLALEAGPNNILLDQILPIEEGQYVGHYAPSGALAFLDGTEDEEAYYQGYYQGDTDVTSFTDSTRNISNSLQVGFDFASFPANSGLRTLAQASGSSGEGPSGLTHATDALHIVWIIGESHAAGRSTSYSSDIPTDRGYCYRRATTSIEHLADPTGNDATSAAGRGSFGPSIGQAMLDATQGAVGTVIINSGAGGTTVSFWSAAGSSWTQAKADWDSAIAAIAAADIPIAGVTIAISLGTNDAFAGTSKADYKAGLIDLIARAKAYVNAGDVPVALVQTGPYADGTTAAAAIAEVQQAQAEVVREEAGVYMATSAPKFAIANGWFEDSVHFNQDGNNAIGPAIAAVSLARGAGCYPAGLEA